MRSVPRRLALVRESLSASGFATARNVMKLNDHIRELTGRPEEYGEWHYWLSVFGAPVEDQPWGWQIDGHHLIINCFVLGDQIVLTPQFLGSEPVLATSGQYAGIRVFEAEEAKGFALMHALSPEQRAEATVSQDLPMEVFSAAFRDNLTLNYQGIRYDRLTPEQQSLLLDLINVYVGRIRPGHAEVRVDEVKAHLDETWFAWMGQLRSGQPVLLPRPQPGDPDRVRPPARHRARQRRADAEPHPHAGAHAERQRLRQGSAAAALRAA